MARSSFDLPDRWGFTREDHREAARAQIKKESPLLLIESLPCTCFSMLQEFKVLMHDRQPEWMAKFWRGKEEGHPRGVLLLAVSLLDSSRAFVFSISTHGPFDRGDSCPEPHVQILDGYTHRDQGRTTGLRQEADGCSVKQWRDR